MKGIQIVLPVSPSVCLFIYDPGCYRVGIRGKKTFPIKRYEDMETLNALQVLNANAVVYFCSERSTNDVAAVRGKFAQHRRKVRPVEAFSEKQGSVLFALQKEDVRIPAPWSFCNVRKNAPTSFGPRDSGIVRLYGRWSAEQMQGKDRLSFTDWIQEKFPELHRALTGG